MTPAMVKRQARCGYIRSVPRCQTCQHIGASDKGAAWCEVGRFPVRQAGHCANWQKSAEPQVLVMPNG